MSYQCRGVRRLGRLRQFLEHECRTCLEKRGKGLEEREHGGMDGVLVADAAQQGEDQGLIRDWVTNVAQGV